MIIELSDFFNNPSLITVGSISIQYYAVTWILSAIFIYLYLANNSITKEIGISKVKANDLVFLYGLIFGAMIGGRVGYMLFYGFEQLINNPLKLFYIWEGGLSFHGGLIGVIISMFVFSKQNNINLIFNYISFLLNSIIIGYFKLKGKKLDIIFHKLLHFPNSI